MFTNTSKPVQNLGHGAHTKARGDSGIHAQSDHGDSEMIAMPQAYRRPAISMGVDRFMMRANTSESWGYDANNVAM